MQRPATKPKWCMAKSKPLEYIADRDELKKRLTPIQYRVTQEKFTERPFSGQYVKLKDNGMYGCIVCSEDLFSSEAKYESGCGWPAFYDITDTKKVKLSPDLSHIGGNILLLALKPDLVRTEVTCAKCGSHLGHLFDDGPKPTGLRYCINSASLKFKQRDNNSNDADGSDRNIGCSRGKCTAIPRIEPVTAAAAKTPIKPRSAPHAIETDGMRSRVPLPVRQPSAPCGRSAQRTLFFSSLSSSPSASSSSVSSSSSSLAAQSRLSAALLETHL